MCGTRNSKSASIERRVETVTKGHINNEEEEEEEWEENRYILNLHKQYKTENTASQH